MIYKVESGVLDVAAYDLECPVHGWRKDYEGKILSLEEYQEIDTKNAEKLGYQIAYDDNGKKLIYF